MFSLYICVGGGGIIEMGTFANKKGRGERVLFEESKEIIFFDKECEIFMVISLPKQGQVFSHKASS